MMIHTATIRRQAAHVDLSRFVYLMSAAMMLGAIVSLLYVY